MRFKDYDTIERRIVNTHLVSSNAQCPASPTSPTCPTRPTSPTSPMCPMNHTSPTRPTSDEDNDGEDENDECEQPTGDYDEQRNRTTTANNDSDARSTTTGGGRGKFANIDSDVPMSILKRNLVLAHQPMAKMQTTGAL